MPSLKTRMKNPFPNLPRTWQRFNNDNGSLLAAGVAYYGALSFFPLLLTLISGVGLVLQLTDAGQNAEAQLLVRSSQALCKIMWPRPWHRCAMEQGRPGRLD
jgi:uncharacterized BrkB/YihY/UPF0761 family membrane protein